MALKTGDEYLRSMKSLDFKAHMLGRKASDLDQHGPGDTLSPGGGLHV